MKLKLNKKTGLIIGAGAFLISIGFLGMMSFQKADEKSQLESQFTLTQTRLQGIRLESLSAQPEELQNQLDLLSENLTQVKAKLSKPVNSTNTTSDIFDAAKANNLVVTKISTSSPLVEIVQGVLLSSISINAEIEGSVSNMNLFIADLNKSLKPSVIKSVEITVPEKTGSGIIPGPAGDNTTASIALVIYTYEGE